LGGDAHAHRVGVLVAVEPDWASALVPLPCDLEGMVKAWRKPTGFSANLLLVQRGVDPLIRIRRLPVALENEDATPIRTELGDGTPMTVATTG
jgi:hypothetical protein